MAALEVKYILMDQEKNICKKKKRKGNKEGRRIEEKPVLCPVPEHLEG